MRLLPGTKKFGFRTIVLTQAQQRSRLFVCLFRMPSFSAPAPPNRFRYPGTRLFRPVRFSGSLPALRPANRASRLHRRPLLLRHPRTASGIPAPVCSVRFAFPEASRPCGPDRPQAPAFRPANRASRLHRHPLRPRRPSASSDSLFRKPPGPAAPIDRKRLLSGLRIVPPVCTAALFGPGTPEPPPVSRRPSAPSDSLFRKPPGPAPPDPRTAFGIPAPVCFVRNRTDAKGSDPPGEVPRHPAVRPVGPPLRAVARLFCPANRASRLHRHPLRPRHPRTASGIPAPVCSVRFAFPEASRPCGPDRPQAPVLRPANRASRLHRRPLRPRHPRTAFGIPAPVCSVRFAFSNASRSCGPDRPQAPAFRPANRLFRLHRRPLLLRHPEPLPVSRHPSASSDSLFRKPPGPAAPIDRKRLFPARESCLPPAPPPSSAPASPNRFRYPGTRLLRPIRFSGSLPALRPRSAASAFFRPANRAFRLHRRSLRPRTPEPLPVSRHPSAPSGTGRTRKAPTLREKCRGIRRSGRSAHPCGPRHGYSAPPVADGAFSVHRCFSISTNHSGQRHGRRVSLRMNPSTVDPVLSSSPRSFRIS